MVERPEQAFNKIAREMVNKIKIENLLFIFIIFDLISIFGDVSFYRVEASWIEWITTYDSPKRHYTSFYDTIFENCLVTVMRTRRVKPASI